MSFWDNMASAGLQALGSVATASVNSDGSKKSQWRAHTINKDLQMQAQQWQEAMWERMQEYALPVNEIQRLLDAGINPALAFSNAGASPQAVPMAATSGGVGTPVVGAPDFGKAVGAFQDQQRVSNESAIAESVIDRNNAEANALNAQAEESGSRKKLNDVEYEIRSDPKYIEALSQYPEIRNGIARLDRDMKDLDYSYGLGTYGLRLESAGLSLDQQKLTYVSSAAELRRIVADTDRIGAYIRYLDAGTAQQRAQAAVLRQDLDIRAGNALMGTLQRDALEYCRDHGVTDSVTGEIVSFVSALSDEYAAKVFDGTYSAQSSAVTANQESIYQEEHGQERRSYETEEIRRRGNWYRTSQWNMSINTGLSFVRTAVDVGATVMTRGASKAVGTLVTPKSGPERMPLSPEAQEVLRKVFPDVEKRFGGF